MINEEVARKTLNIQVQAGKKLATVILSELKKIMKEAKSVGGLEKLLKQKGSNVKLKDLVKKGQLEEIAVSDKDLKSLKKELNKNGVKFSVMKDKESGNYSVFFQAKDIKVMDKTFRNVIVKNEKKEKMKESVRTNLEKFKEAYKSTISKDKIKNKKQERNL